MRVLMLFIFITKMTFSADFYIIRKSEGKFNDINPKIYMNGLSKGVIGPNEWIKLEDNTIGDVELKVDAFSYSSKYIGETVTVKDASCEEEYFFEVYSTQRKLIRHLRIKKISKQQFIKKQNWIRSKETKIIGHRNY